MVLNSNCQYLHVKNFHPQNSAAARQGTAATKTRAMVRGGGRKPFKQKVLVEARQGSIRAPHMVGGGVKIRTLNQDHTRKKSIEC